MFVLVVNCNGGFGSDISVVMVWVSFVGLFVWWWLMVFREWCLFVVMVV